MSYLSDNFPNYDCDELGNIYKFGDVVKPFKSNKYLQVCIFDVSDNKRVYGVHQIVAMKYLNFFKGCVVHHIDGNPHNNSVSNLCVSTRSEHSREHAIESNAGKYITWHGGWNKGIPASDKTKQKCRESAYNRMKESGCGFYGNQYVNADGSRKK